MPFKEIMGILGAIAFCFYIVVEYYRGKKIEKISENLTQEETKSLRRKLMTQRDFSWLATIKLPKVFECIGNILAVLVILFLLTLFIMPFLQC